jgi:hypothetical protein
MPMKTVGGPEPLASTVHFHAAERWAECVVTIVRADADPRTLVEWARIAGVSVGTLKDRCVAAGIRAKASLDFARLLRAVVISGGGFELREVLDVLHARTLRRLLSAGGFTGLNARKIPVDEYLARQRFVSDHKGLEAVSRLLSAREPTVGRAVS